MPVTWIVRVSLTVAPFGLVTETVTTWSPASSYAWLALRPLTAGLPSPKLHTGVSVTPNWRGMTPAVNV